MGVKGGIFALYIPQNLITTDRHSFYFMQYWRITVLRELTIDVSILLPSPSQTERVLWFSFFSFLPTNQANQLFIKFKLVALIHHNEILPKNAKLTKCKLN